MKKQLCAGWDSIPTQLVFGELVSLAWPILIHYRSDLYHDAQWLERNLLEGVPFYYGVRPTGTDIGDRHVSNTGIAERKTWRCELTLEDSKHYLTITEETN